ncbi:hypothetical protein F2P81_016872 [Scophthalmus maximus]|uniref:Uncharacterized protein n=1 Tax=Scophthalmus maximus TaxID=52904 RepID=A0A6A4SG56_SCOMX|nr:hypothetical protein F2P81_016872 [Scophthalmus maximus]
MRMKPGRDMPRTSPYVCGSPWMCSANSRELRSGREVLARRCTPGTFPDTVTSCVAPLPLSVPQVPVGRSVRGARHSPDRAAEPGPVKLLQLGEWWDA